MSEMIADKARNMLLEEERRLAKDMDTSISLYGAVFAALRSLGKRISSRKAAEAIEDMKCFKCGKRHKDQNCWRLHPE